MHKGSPTSNRTRKIRLALAFAVIVSLVGSNWFWGGSFGGGLGLLLLILIGGKNDVVLGAAAVWIAQFIGYAIAFIGWKIAHRAAES